MSISRTVNISCPSCGVQQDVELYDAINVSTEPELKDALMLNQLNRVECPDCELSFRVDLPLLYNEPQNNMLIYWVPETEETTRDDILEEFDRSMEKMNEMLPSVYCNVCSIADYSKYEKNQVVFKHIIFFRIA